MNLLKLQSASPLVNYAYDLAGRSREVSDNGASVAAMSGPASYAVSTSYDALNRPLGVSRTPVAAQTGVTFTHTYDANDRRIGQTASDGSWGQ